MKTKYLLRTLIILVIPALFYFILAGFKTSNEEISGEKASYFTFTQPAKDFTNFILNTDYHSTPSPWDMQYFAADIGDVLHFNGVHIYDYDSGNGTTRLGRFNISLNGDQIDTVRWLIN